MSAPSSERAAPPAAAMSVFERYLTVWVALCIVVGITLGQLFPAPVQAIGGMEFAQVNLPVGVLIWVMIIPMLLRIDFAALGQVKNHVRGIGVTLVINWLVKPFSMALLAWIFIKHLFAPWLPPDQIDSYVAGLILLAAAPCTAMVFVWSRLTNGDPYFTLSQVALNDTIMIFGLDHHAQQRFGARRPDQHPPLPVQLALHLAEHGLQRSVLLPVEAVGQPHVDQRLRHQRQVLGQLREVLSRTAHGGQHLQGTDDAVAGGVPVEAQQVAGTLAAETPASFLEHLQHVAVADLGAGERHVQLASRRSRAKLVISVPTTPRHRTVAHAVAHDHVQQLVAVVLLALAVDQDQPVGIAVDRDAEVGAAVAHGTHERLRMDGADAVVDVEAVRLRADGDHLGAEFVEHRRRDVVGGAVRAVDHQLEAAQVERVGEGALAELDVAAGRVLEPARLAEAVRVDADQRLVELGLDLGLDLVGSFLPSAEKNLMPLSG
jgi:hypothetical protein